MINRQMPPKLKEATIAVVFLRSRMKFAIPMETGLSLMCFLRLCTASGSGENRTASTGEMPEAIFIGLRMETDTIIQQITAAKTAASVLYKT